MPNQTKIFRTAILCAVLLTSCGNPEESSSRKGEGRSDVGTPRELGPVTLNSVEEVKAFYEADPEFFMIKTTADIPKDLKWNDGSDEQAFGSPKAKRGGTFNYFTADWPRTLRFVGPDASGSFRSFILDHNVLSLVELHPETDGYYPSIARRWAVGEDKRTVFFELDPDASYSDGEPVRVTDFFFHFYFMRSKHIKAPWYNDHYDSEKFKNITLYDTRTLSVTYYKAKPDVVEKLSLRPVPEHHYEELDEDYLKDYQWVFEPTTGPYEVKEENINEGVSITLTRVPNWWADQKKFFKNRFNPEKIRVTVIREPAKVFELFRKGEIDLFALDLPSRWYEKLPNGATEVAKGYIHKTQFFNQIPRPSWALYINCLKPLLNNRDVRVGLHHAMNWALVIKEVFHGDYARMQSVADGYGRCSHPSVKAREFSVEMAEEAFAKAGFTERGADGILKNSKGQRLSFTITTGYKRFTPALTVLQQEARKAGVEIKLEILEKTAGWKKIHEKEHEIAFGGLNNFVELYPRFWDLFHSDNAYQENGDSKYADDGSLKKNLTVKPNTNNFSSSADRELDKLIKQYREAEDFDEITRLSHELIERLHDHAGYIPSWVIPWYRVGYWRWVKWPENFNLKESRDWEEFHVHWIDTDAKTETIEAKKTGKTFEKVIKVFDQWK